MWFFRTQSLDYSKKRWYIYSGVLSSVENPATCQRCH